MLKISKSKLREIIREVIREANGKEKYYARKSKGKQISVFTDKDNWKNAIKAQGYKAVDQAEAEAEMADQKDAEPTDQKGGKPKEKPKPKVTKIAADPFADKDSETGKDYTRKFMGTDEPDDWYDDSETAYQGGEEPVHKIATDVYYINKYEGGGDSFEQEAVPAYKISNIEDMLAADSGNQLYISKGEEGYFDGKSFTSEKGSTTTLEPDHVKGTDEPEDDISYDPSIPDVEKHADTIMAITKDDVEFDGYDANDRPMFVSSDDPELEYTVDQKGNIWRHDGFKDKVIGQTSAGTEESIIPQLKKEFKQYGFTQKSKNWKRIMI